MYISAENITAFQEQILSWYSKNRRELPWRDTRNPYAVLVSEFMSQQTQISRVIPKYLAWMATLPTVQDTANASTGTVLSLWSGLGYNRRALYLLQAAKVITNEYNGVFPDSRENLLLIPGIGEYTASAILCFAFNQQIPVIDTNVRKVISITFFNGIVPSKDILEETARRLIPNQKAYEWHQALMDYAAIELKKKRIPVFKQSTFLGSDRYYRGAIMKYLVYKKAVAPEVLQNELAITQERFLHIIENLKKEGLLETYDGNLILPP